VGAASFSFDCGGDERWDKAPTIGLPQQDTIGYVEICRAKLVETIASESTDSLAGPSGFSAWFSGLGMSCGELHLYNVRHVQHHRGQLSAYLRKVDAGLMNSSTLRWIRTGWS